MSERYAVIDLGTNTFHLLIAEAGENKAIQPVFRKRIFVKLGAEGIATIGQAPFERGLEAMRTFRHLLNEQKVQLVKAIGTAALRTATNGPDFLAAVREQTGIEVELITGDQEAVWIYKGVRQAIDLGQGSHLIIDIGGGSVEFILANKKGMIWRQSFPIGLAVLFGRFHHSDPMHIEEREAVERFLEEQLLDLWSAVQKYPPQTLAGAAGVFEILEHFLPSKKISGTQRNFKCQHFEELHQTIINSTLSERLAMEKLPDSRADMIVVAMLLIGVVLQKTGIQEIAVSDYAMKEGILCEFLECKQ